MNELERCKEIYLLKFPQAKELDSPELWDDIVRWWNQRKRYWKKVNGIPDLEPLSKAKQLKFETWLSQQS